MSKKRKIVIISIIIGVIFILIVFGVYTLITNIQKDKQQTKENIQTIKSTYEIFNNKVNVFNEKRTNVVNALSEGFYFETIENTITEWNTLLNEYQNCILDSKQEVETLDNYCKATYLDHDINQKCEIYKKNYEIMVNTLINDIITYNNKINEYNTWVDTNPTFHKVEMYTSTEYQNYIDYDNDGIFLNSKEES